MSSENQPIKNEVILLTGVLKIIEVVPYSLEFLRKTDWEKHSQENKFNEVIRPLLKHSAVKESIKITNNWLANCEKISYRIHQYAITAGKKKSKRKKTAREELRELIAEVNASLREMERYTNYF